MVGLGQSTQPVYASVFSSWDSHSEMENGLNVVGESTASAVASSSARCDGVAFMLNSCG